MRFPPSSTALFHYFDLVGLETRPFPNPLAADRLTVIELEGKSFYAETLEDLQPLFGEVAGSLAPGARGGRFFRRHAGRDPRARCRPHQSDLKCTNADSGLGRAHLLYGFISTSDAFRRPSFRHREVSGRSASAPAAGIPTSRTRCSRSCGSSTPTPPRTIAWWSAASSSCRCASGVWPRRGSYTGRAAPVSRP